MKAPVRRALIALLTLLWAAGLLAITAEDYTYTTNDGTITITMYTGPGGDVTIPPTINGLPVTGIGESAFSGCTSLTGILIPDSVTRIGDNAFRDCSNLTNIVIGNGVTTIGWWAFIGCAGLTRVDFEGNAPEVAGGWRGYFDDTKATLHYLPGTKG